MQGKTNKQYESSMRAIGYAFVGMIIMMIVLGGHELYKHCMHHYWDTHIEVPDNNYWIPSEADKLWLDSLYEQVKRTEDDVIDLNATVNRIDRKIDEIMLRRIDYPDGSWDSIKVKPSKFKPTAKQ
tara:strand:- start:213 stop:590 length:378 start_codon:yes stop_codon:yes gene_type:complete